MSGTNNAERERPLLTWKCYPFLAIGTEGAQLMMAVLGLFLACSVYNINPGIDSSGGRLQFKGNGWGNLIPLSLFVIAIPLGGLLSARRYSKILCDGEITSAELYQVERCRLVDSYEFTFLVSDPECSVRRFQMTRQYNDMQVGESVTVLLNAKLDMGWLECDLPRGITFAQLCGWDPVPGTSWLVALVIPVLTLVPLLGLIGPVAAFVQLHGLYLGSFILQLIWYSGNRKRFFSDEPFQLNPRRGCCPNV